MSPKLRAEIEADLEQMSRLMEQITPIVARAGLEPAGNPTAVEIAALGAMLHAFYNGVENILRRVAAELEGGAPAGADWHAALLAGASQATRGRGILWSKELVARLREYLQFRHVFRHAYTFELRWPKMQPLAMDIEPTFRELQRQTRAFMSQFYGAE